MVCRTKEAESILFSGIECLACFVEGERKARGVVLRKNIRSVVCSCHAASAEALTDGYG